MKLPVPCKVSQEEVVFKAEELEADVPKPPASAEALSRLPTSS